MSNRKYLGLLEGSNQTDEERMLSISSVIAEWLNDILDGMDVDFDKQVTENIRHIARGKLMSMAPELDKTYDLLITMYSPVTGPPDDRKVAVFFRKRITFNYTGNLDEYTRGVDWVGSSTAPTERDFARLRDIATTRVVADGQIHVGYPIEDSHVNDINDFLEAETRRAMSMTMLTGIQNTRLEPIQIRERYGAGYLHNNAVVAHPNRGEGEST